MMNTRISYGKAVYDNYEIEAVVKTLKKSSQMGENVSKFESKVSKLFAKKYGVMVNSGSSALLLAFESLRAFNNSKKIEIITPVLTFATTVSSMIKCGFKPVFVDVNVDTLCVQEELIKSKINKNTFAICIPNLIGNLPNWKFIKKIANKNGLVIIEDSADTLGAKYNKIPTGKYSDISITSFYGSHVINCAGNGGLLATNNFKIYQKTLLLRSWGRNSSLFKDSEGIDKRFNLKIDNIDYDRKFVFSELGYNLEPSEIGASFGLIQLKKLSKNISIRKKNFNIHKNFFSKFKDIFILPNEDKLVNTCWLAYPIILKDNIKFTRKQFMSYLEKKGIQTRVIFTGNILRQPGFKFLQKNQNKNHFPNADYIMKNGILIGLHHGLTKKDLNYIHKVISTFLAKSINV